MLDQGPKTRDKYIKCLERRFSSLKSTLQTFLFLYIYSSMVLKVQNCQVYADSVEPRRDKLIVFEENIAQ